MKNQTKYWWLTKLNGGLSLIILLSSVLTGFQALGQSTSPIYKANVPESITTPDEVKTERLGTLNFFDGMPDDVTVEKVFDNLDHLRGVETFLSSIPACSIYAYLEGLESIGVEPNKGFGISEDLINARQLLLTPNTTTMYIFGNFDLADGPVVIEAAPALITLIDDATFGWVTDIGFTGPDKGKGGKYLLVPPGYKGDLPKEGYFIVHSKTYRNFMLGRALVKDGDKKATLKVLKAKMRVYPYSQAANPPATTFVNLSDKKYNTIAPNDFSVYEDLNAIVQHEPSDAFSPEVLGLWRSIGIIKGKPFAPDARMKKILVDAVAVGNATARAISFRSRQGNMTYFYSDRQWYSPAAAVAVSKTKYDMIDNGALLLNNQIMYLYLATGVTPSMVSAPLGEGSAYALGATDSEKRYLDGGNTYSVTLPGPVPAKNFWSFVVYDSQTRSLLETDQISAGVDSNKPDLKVNADGSYTVWFGPKAPKGKEANWVQTMPNKSFFVLVRLYGPLEPWYNKTWKPGDFELVK